MKKTFKMPASILLVNLSFLLFLSASFQMKFKATNIENLTLVSNGEKN